MISCMVPGSFDPPTKGHLDVIERCAGIFDHVVVAIVANPAKEPMFTAEERKSMLEGCVEGRDNIEVDVEGSRHHRQGSARHDRLRL